MLRLGSAVVGIFVRNTQLPWSNQAINLLIGQIDEYVSKRQMVPHMLEDINLRSTTLEVGSSHTNQKEIYCLKWAKWTSLLLIRRIYQVYLG